MIVNRIINDQYKRQTMAGISMVSPLRVLHPCGEYSPILSLI